MSKLQTWEFCANPKKNDTIKWDEPIWAKPNKPRGKRDKIGEQTVTAKVLENGETMDLEVMAVEKSHEVEELTVKTGDKIKRKKSSLEKGDCHRLVK